MIDRNFILNLAKRDTDINEYLMSLYNISVQMKAKMVVELGAGQSTYAFTAAVNKTYGELYSIDMGPEAHLRLFPEGKGVLENEIRYHPILGDDLEVVKKWDKPIDFLLIDTNHTYEHTVLELQTWPEKVVGGGVIALHDTGHEGEGMQGVRHALNEFIERHENNFTVLHLLDTKLIGLSLLVKIPSS